MLCGASGFSVKSRSSVVPKSQTVPFKEELPKTNKKTKDQPAQYLAHCSKRAKKALYFMKKQRLDS